MCAYRFDQTLSVGELPDAHRDDVLVVRAVEDADLAACGHACVDAPEEVVRQLLGRRRLERLDATALRVHAGEHRADHAVLAGCVHALQHEQHCTPRLGVQASVQNAETRRRASSSRSSPSGFDVRAGARAGVAACELRRLAWLHTELVEQLHEPEYAVTAVTTSSPRGAFELRSMAHKHVDLTAAARAAFRDKLRRKRRTVDRPSRAAVASPLERARLIQRRADPEAIPMSLRVGAFLSPRQPAGPTRAGRGAVP